MNIISMKNEQKVCIKGDSKRGAEVIKLLEDLGGRNCHNCKGDADKNIYYINPLGDINCVMECQYSEWLLVKEFYKEITLPKWKPEYGDNYYFINYKGMVMKNTWFNSVNEYTMYEFGNCFKTENEAIEASNKIKEVLNNR